MFSINVTYFYFIITPKTWICFYHLLLTINSKNYVHYSRKWLVLKQNNYVNNIRKNMLIVNLQTEQRI